MDEAGDLTVESRLPSLGWYLEMVGVEMKFIGEEFTQTVYLTSSVNDCDSTRSAA